MTALVHSILILFITMILLGSVLPFQHFWFWTESKDLNSHPRFISLTLFGPSIVACLRWLMKGKKRERNWLSRGSTSHFWIPCAGACPSGSQEVKRSLSQPKARPGAVTAHLPSVLQPERQVSLADMEPESPVGCLKMDSKTQGSLLHTSLPQGVRVFVSCKLAVQLLQNYAGHSPSACESCCQNVHS